MSTLDEWIDETGYENLRGLTGTPIANLVMILVPLYHRTGGEFEFVPARQPNVVAFRPSNTRDVIHVHFDATGEIIDLEYFEAK